jgi:hypothetical protein
MSKRFCATERWEKPWFRRLEPRLKCLWEYIVSRCDCAGVWEPDFELASFYIGEAVNEHDLDEFGERLESIGDGKFWVVDFVGFQYGHLSHECKPHRPVLERLDRYGLLQAVAERASKGYRKGIKTLEEKEKDQVKEKEGEEEVFP